MRGDRRNSYAHRLQERWTASPTSGDYTLGDFDGSDSEPWFRTPSQGSYLGLDSLRRPARSRAGWGTTQTSSRGSQLVIGPQLG
jgi:hypothetical protein